MPLEIHLEKLLCMIHRSAFPLFTGEMNMNKANNEVRNDTVPTIKKVIDGRVYTVKIHFSNHKKENPQEKVRRMLRNDVLNRSFTEKLQDDLPKSP